MSTALSPEAQGRAFHMFQASRDYLFAWEVLMRGRPPRELQQHVAWPRLAQVLLATIALELALKSLVTLEGKVPKRTHCTEPLFAQMEGAVQQKLADALRIEGKQGTPAAVISVLRSLDNGAPLSRKRVSPFEAWRYHFEHKSVKYDAQNIEVLTRAIHRLLLQRRSDWKNWPGIIVR